MIQYERLLKRTSRLVFEEAILIVLENPEEIDNTLIYFESGTETQKNRISWLLHHVSDAKPELLIPYHSFFIELGKRSTNAAVKRFISRLFANHGLPDGSALQGQLLDLAFIWVNSFSESIAVKVNSLSVIHRFCRIHPELENELRAIIADQLPNSAPAFKSRSRKILRELNPLKP